MDRRTYVLFHGANGSLHLRDMLIGSDSVEYDGGDVRSRASKLAVSVDSLHVEPPLMVLLNNGADESEHGWLGAIRDGSSVANVEITGNGVEEGKTLDVKKINAETYIKVMRDDMRRERSQHGKGNVAS